MKKFLIMLMATMFAVSVDAQTAVQTSKLFDNTYVGVTVGATTPLDFNSVFPVNTVAGLKVGKELTSVVGVEADGLVVLNNNHFNFPVDPKTFVKATNVGLNGTINLSNLFWGYKGTPRVFEVKTNTGLGWLHTWDYVINNLSAKTGVDFLFNLGKNKASTIEVSPVVYWNLNKKHDSISPIAFNKNNAQLGVTVSYVYHFKTSNGTHHFKTYDVGALIDENTRLAEELARKPQVVEKIVERVTVQEVPSTDAVANINNTTEVRFAFREDVLTAEEKENLNGIVNLAKVQDIVVDVYGYASSEDAGQSAYNLTLSERRAKNTAEYLTENGVNVGDVKWYGAETAITQRVVKVVLR